MDFINLNYLMATLAVVAVFSILFLRIRRKFIVLVGQIWNFKVRKISLISTIFYFLAFFAFAISLGDLRGPEEMVESSIPNQRTVILIDNSMSMLVEDIRPNRISKAAIIAKHFVKNAYGHQVALSIFSDIQKKIVPFTDDMDILESRLGTMLGVQPEGGSNVSLALKEAFQYFKTSNGYDKGNILLITDGEEHGGVDVEIPEEISLAIVGVGTTEGGKIPERNKKGNFLRYKKYNGVEVVSKLNKNFFENLVSKAKYSKVWFVESYSLPTNEIINFFKNIHLNSFSKGSFRSRPVYGYWLIIVAIVFYILFVLCGRLRTFRAISCVVCVLTIAFQLNSFSQESEDEVEVKMTPYQNELVDKLREGSITKEEKLKLGELYLKQKGGEKQAAEIFSETLSDYDKEDNVDLFNYATSLLKTNRFDDSINLYRYIKGKNKNNKELIEAIDEQVKLALKKQKQKKKEEQDKKNKKKDKNNKDNKNNKDKKNQNNQSDNKDQKKGKGTDQKDQNKSEGKGQNKKKDDKEKSEGKKKEENDPSNGNKKKKQKTKQQQWQQIESEAKKKKRMRKANGVFKQIMNDDANLQRKFIDTSSEGNSQRKDW